MSSRIPDPGDPFEEEGLPGMNDGLPEKRITGDSQEGIPAAHDESVAVEDWGTTAREEREGEPLDLRLQREEPDTGAAADRPADESPEADSPYPEDPELRAGRIVQPDEGVREDTEPHDVAYDVGTDGGGFSAEERAMHIEREV